MSLSAGSGSLPLAADQSQAPPWAKEAQDILRLAWQEEASIIEQAHCEAEKIHDAAYEKGFKTGQAEGMAASMLEASGHLRRIAEVAENAAAEMSQVLNQSEETLVKLALAVAEKIIQKNLNADRSLVQSIVRWAIEQVDAMEVIRVRVNPEDLEILQPYWEESRNNKIELTPDARVQAGGCIIDTNKSVVDAQIGTMLAEIGQAFESYLEANQR